MSTPKEATPEELQEVSAIGKRFRTYLVHRNLTFAEAATLLDVSPSMITRLADGVNMTVDLLERIVITFPSLNYHWLLNGTGMMEHSALEQASKDYLTGEATRVERKKLSDLEKEFLAVPAWQHGPLTEQALSLMQAFMDEAQYLDRLGLSVQRQAQELLRFHRKIQ